MRIVFCIVGVFLLQLPIFCQSQHAIDRYLELHNCYPVTFGEKGNWLQGEIETIFDYQTICKVQADYFQKFLKKGVLEEEADRRSQLGIIAEDAYWVWIREALLFPSGHCDIYNRFIPKGSLARAPGRSAMCAVVLVQLPNQKIAMNLIFRNGTRSWELELPRGGIEPGEFSADAAKREVQEETGYLVDTVFHIGTYPMDSATCPQFFDAYFAKTEDLGDTAREKGEVIASVIALSKQEAKEALCKGQIEIEINGKKIVAFCRDYHMAYALLLAEMKGFL
jgi:ADP-ribose pyrophosphatase